MKELDVCDECGRSEDEHHTFYPIVLPDTCQCDHRTWQGGIITAVCEAYAASSPTDPDSYCAVCEHDRECHWEAQ